MRARLARIAAKCIFKEGWRSDGDSSCGKLIRSLINAVLLINPGVVRAVFIYGSSAGNEVSSGMVDSVSVSERLAVKGIRDKISKSS
jgi:hypothetical protein